MKRLDSVLLGICMVLLSTAAVQARDLGTYGAVYPIAEKDALSEIEARAKEVNWKKALDPKKAEKKIKEHRPPGLIKLPPSLKDGSFSVDGTYSMQMDVPDGKGGVLYPKGYTFNPLDYVFLPRILVFLDGSDERQIEWFKSSPYKEDFRTMLLLTDGPYYEIMQDLKIPVYYANRKIIDRLGLKAVPSVVVQNGKLMQVREYDINLKKAKTR